MKHLPKHLQPRWRYLAVELRTDGAADFDRGTFQRAVWFAAQNLVGDAGSAAVDLSIVRFGMDDERGYAIVRTRRGESERGRAVLACVDGVGDVEVGLRVRGVSGTVRACVDGHLSDLAA